MRKIVLITLGAALLAGCTPREQQLLAAGAVGAVAGAVVANEVSRPQPVYVEERRYVAPPRRPRCYSVWERTYGGMIERRVCD
jgi:uncharacterized protein YcfJ